MGKRPCFPFRDRRLMYCTTNGTVTPLVRGATAIPQNSSTTRVLLAFIVLAHGHRRPRPARCHASAGRYSDCHKSYNSDCQESHVKSFPLPKGSVHERYWWYALSDVGAQGPTVFVFDVLITHAPVYYHISRIRSSDCGRFVLFLRSIWLSKRLQESDCCINDLLRLLLARDGGWLVAVLRAIPAKLRMVAALDGYPSCIWRQETV